MRPFAGHFRLLPSDCIVWQCLLILIASFAVELNAIPASIFNQKNNAINKLIVGYGWGLTLLSVIIQLLVSTRFIGGRQWPLKLRKPTVRLIVATIVWFVATTLMTFVRDTSGGCKHEEANLQSTSDLSYGKCMKSGGSWTGFDSSGHIFLMTFNALVMAEEARAYLVADRLYRTHKADVPELNWLKEQYDRVTVFRVLSTIIIYLLLALWSFVSLMTCFYFHTFLEKMIGFLVAVVAHWLLYGGLQLANNEPGMSELDEQLHSLVPSDVFRSKPSFEKKPELLRKLFWIASVLSHLMGAFILS